jgi:citrate lyase beta subunit
VVLAPEARASDSAAPRRLDDDGVREIGDVERLPADSVLLDADDAVGAAYDDAPRVVLALLLPLPPSDVTELRRADDAAVGRINDDETEPELDDVDKRRGVGARLPAAAVVAADDDDEDVPDDD